MASFVWTSVYWFLLFEICVTFILVIPVPRKIRNFFGKQINKLNLGENLGKVGLFIIIALIGAICDSVSSIQHLRARLHDSGGGGNEHEYIFHDLDKQRKFKAQRNLYLASFALTLMFCILRISQLMQESVELEEEVEKLRKSIQWESTNSDGVTKTSSVIETTAVKNSAEKKKD